MENLIGALLADRSVAVVALLLGNVAQAVALIQSWRWHRRDREQDTQRWLTELERHNDVLDRVTDALTNLRVIISQCSGVSRNGQRRS